MHIACVQRSCQAQILLYCIVHEMLDMNMSRLNHLPIFSDSLSGEGSSCAQQETFGYGNCSCAGIFDDCCSYFVIIYVHVAWLTCDKLPIVIVVLTEDLF